MERYPDGGDEPTAAPRRLPPSPTRNRQRETAQKAAQTPPWPLLQSAALPLPTLKYPNLDSLVVEADASEAVMAHLDTIPEVPVIIWMTANTDNGKTKSLVNWLKAPGVPADYVSVSGRTEGY